MVNGELSRLSMEPVGLKQTAKGLKFINWFTINELEIMDYN